MNVNLSKLRWYNKDNIWTTGFILSEGLYLREENLVKYFSGIETPEAFERILSSANGQFSVVIETAGKIFAATDRIRNFPLFYTHFDGHFIISDDCYTLAEIIPERTFDQNSVNSFMAAGYVINNRTLLKEIYQVEAGSYVILGTESESKFYFDCTLNEIIKTNITEGAKKFQELLNNVFKEHLVALKNRFIVIPLSGGYDSRVVAAMVKAYHPGNVLCYTYGSKNNPEVQIAGEVARRLDLKWINIVYDTELVKDFLHDGFFSEYYPYVSDFSGMFFFQEYFAVKYLKERNLVPANTVFMSGFSGDMLAGSYLIRAMEKNRNKHEIAKLIFREYFRLIDLRAQVKADTIKLIEERIPEGKSPVWRIVEGWDMRERHAKFIVNSAKVFSFFRYEYVFPFWDNRLVDYCMSLPFSLRLNRKLYECTLKKYIFSGKDLNFHNEINPGPYKKNIQRIKEKIKPFLPARLRSIFIKLESPILYDEITKILLEDVSDTLIIPPMQPNYYNSYITQWYLLTTRRNLKVKDQVLRAI